ncbi:MAG: family 1 encapsulin nanocompartment shell protein [Acidimicrobiales bacterium]
MNHLHRELAPISDEAWKRVDDEARDALHEFLAGRRLVDVDGPHGWAFAAVPTGAIDAVTTDGPSAETGGGATTTALRSVLRLVEVRVPFSIDRETLRKVDRGAPDVALDTVVEAARRAAAIEDDAIFAGLEAADIMGCLSGSEHEPVTYLTPAEITPAVAEAIAVLQDAGIEGPYGLALDPDAWRSVVATTDRGYPLIQHLRLLIDGPVVRAPTLHGGLLVSQRGGDFELIIGGDLAIGYESSDATSIELYLTESFTFRNLEPAAGAALRQG